MRNTPKRSATDLVKYMGTREGVEKVAEGIDNSPATVRQQRLVQDIIKFDSSAKDYGEYQDYESFPIKSNASEFIDAFIERNADRIGELDKLFTMETDLRDRLKKESREEIEKLIAKIRDSYAPTSEIEMLFLKLASQLKTCKGRKQYGYLPKDVKDTVNRIVAELAKDDDIAKLNLEWNKVNREKLSLYFEKKGPDVALEDNPEFRSIKNIIVRSATLAMKIMDAEHSQNYDVGSSIRSVVSALCKLISKSYEKKVARLNTQIDSKLMSKIEQKKAAHGLKIDRGVRQEMDDEDYGMRM